MIYSLIVSALIFIPGILAVVLGRRKEAFWLLLFSAFVIRLMMIGLDPFLHNWDERFHAVVAKNMMQYPFKPMMRLEALLPYNLEDWCCSYIWVHKQPLFLWQMALSMKLLGVNIIALRLPNVIMETFAIYCIYRIAEIWTRNLNTAYLAALLFAGSYYSLELCAGSMSLDHNDVTMGGYVTASIWAFCEYTEKKTWKWVILTGLFAGCAILVKWLTGLLIFGGWGLYIIINSNERTRLLSYKHWLGALGVCLFVFLPWQLYIRLAFPLESEASYQHNYKHIFEDLGHPGTIWTHLEFMTTAYSGIAFILLLVSGLILSWRTTINRYLSLSLFSMFAVIYAFFSIIVKTKMPGLTYPVASIGFIWIGIGLEFFRAQVVKITSRIPSLYLNLLATILIFVVLLYAYQPQKMALARKADNIERMEKIHNTEIYRKLDQYTQPNEIILNCKSFEDTEVRFWQPNNAYHWYPQERELDSLIHQGYKFAAFKNHNDQNLPDYIARNPEIKIIDLQLE